MADSVGEGSNGAIGSAVGTSQGNGAQLLPSLGNSLPGHSASGANPASPPPAAAAETGLAVMDPGVADSMSPMDTAYGSGVDVLTTAMNSAVSPPFPVHPALPPSIGLGVTGAPNLAGAGLLSQIHATSWDPTLSTDWDNEKASQQCILRIKR